MAIGVAEIADCDCDDLSEIASPQIASKLVSAISPSFFGKNAGLMSWTMLVDKINDFTATKGLQIGLEFDSAGVEKGDLGSLLAATVQILALIGLYNRKVWNSMLNKIDHASSTQIRLSTEEIMKDIETSIETSETKDIRRLCEKLEVEEEKRVESEEKCKQLETYIHSLSTQLDNANSMLQKKTQEVQEANRIRDMTLRQMEEMMNSQAPFQAESHDRMLKQLNRAKEELSHKLMLAEASSAESSAEAEKLRVLLSISEGRRREAETVHETCERLRKANEELRAEKEIADSKLQLLSVGEKALLKYQEKLKVESQKYFDLKIAFSELENKLALTEKKLQTSTENFQLLKSANDTESDNLSTQISFQLLEEENNSLKQQLKNAMNELSRVSFRSMDKESQENINEVNALKLRTLSLENNLLNARNTRLTIASKIGTFTNLETQKSSADTVPRPSISTTNEVSQEEISRVKKACDEKIEMMYTVFMQYSREAVIGNTRLFCPDRAERKRDVLKPFTLNNILKGAMH